VVAEAIQRFIYIYLYMYMYINTFGDKEWERYIEL
jgi:hypothetical protein